MTSAQASLFTDPAVPGLALLLDDARLASWLAEHGQRLKQRCYVRYKPGTSCVVGLQLQSGWAFALAASGAAQPKLEKLQHRVGEEHVLALDRHQRVLLASVWGDRDLPALCDLPRAVGRLLPEVGPYRVRTLVHKPHRRWVALVDQPEPSGPVLLRAYRRHRAAAAGQRLKLARQVREVVRVPRLLGRSARWDALAVEYLPGRTVQQLVSIGSGAAEAAAAGRALAAVHSREPSRMPATEVADPAATAELVGAVLPHLGRRTRDVLATLEARRPAAPAPSVCHGDFSLDQVLVGPDGRVAFLDWDRGGAGTPAADLGSVAASGVEPAVLRSLYAGYSELRPLPADLDWYVAQAKILRLAEPFRLARTGWAGEVEQRLEDLERSLA